MGALMKGDLTTLPAVEAAGAIRDGRLMSEALVEAYLKRIEEAVGAPIDIISTGPDRAETIVLKDPFQ